VIRTRRDRNGPPVRIRLPVGVVRQWGLIDQLGGANRALTWVGDTGSNQ